MSESSDLLSRFREQAFADSGYDPIMNLFGRTEFTSIELPDALEFSIVHEVGLFEQCLFVAIPCIFLWVSSRASNSIVSIFFLLGCVSSAAYGVANWIHGRETHLRVRSGGLTAEGNLRRLAKTSLAYATDEINWLRWESGGEDGPTGLYVGRGWSSACVLPDINKEQAQMIRDRISARFPQFPLGDESSGLFGSADELTTLGLSKPAETKSVIRS